VSARLRATLEHVVQQAGGKLVDSVPKAQVYIGAWREKDDYIQALSNRDGFNCRRVEKVLLWGI